MTELGNDAREELRLAAQVHGDRMQTYHQRQAQVYATLALTEQLEAANLIAYSTQIVPKWAGMAEADVDRLMGQIGPRIVAALDLRAEPRE